MSSPVSFLPGQTPKPISSGETPSPPQAARVLPTIALSPCPMPCLSHVMSVPCHVCPPSAPESPRSIPLDKEENGCQGRVGNSPRTHSRAWTAGACRPESQPGLHRMVCGHLPEVPVHRGVQGAQAAQWGPEEKAIASVPSGIMREWVQAFIQQTCPGLSPRLRSLLP